ncbi:MAG: MBL fold metallo-hydrolase [Bacteroidota bacterium]
MTTLGGYTLHALDTGRFGLDGGAMFGIIPRALWARHSEPDSKNRIPMGMRCLLLEGHGRLILIDNGLGDTYTEKFGSIYAVDYEHSELHRSLRAAGFDASEVTDVVLTHLHFDHCGGSTTRDADGTLRLVFPNATHHVQATHWAWAHESPRERASFLAENLGPLDASGQLHLLTAAHSGPGSLFPHVELLTVDGHTRGQQLVKLTAETNGSGETLLFAADLLPTVAHVPLLWIMAYDIAPLDTLAEKKRLLAQAADEEWRIFFEHDAAVTTGRIARSERGDYVVEDAAPTL